MTTKSASLCAIAKNEVPYIEEWVEYHLALGFAHIFIYDNEDVSTLSAIFKENACVTVRHFPGRTAQYLAYNHFLQSAESHQHFWSGFLDIDEFLVLKKHDNVLTFLNQHCPKGIVAMNWVVYGEERPKDEEPTNRVDTEDPRLPVTQRFILREPLPNRHVKCLFARDDVVCIHNAHFPLGFSTNDPIHIDDSGPIPFMCLTNGTKIALTQHDTNGKVFFGPFNPDGPTDVAYINHYYFRSKTEYAIKYNSIGADGMPKGTPWSAHPTRNDYLDQSAWTVLSLARKEKAKGQLLLLYIVCHDDKSQATANDLVKNIYPYAKVVRVPNNSPYFESEVFLELAKPDYKNDWNSGHYKYVGVITYSFVKKMGNIKILEELQKLIEKEGEGSHNDIDVASILNLDFGKTRVNRPVSFVESISMQHGPFLWLAISRVLKTLVPSCRRLSEKELLNKNIKGFFSNWFVAKPTWMDRYVKFYANARKLCETNAEIAECVREDSYYIGQNTMTNEQLVHIFGRPQYGLEPFLFERLPPLFFGFEGAKVARFDNPKVVMWGLCD